MALQTQLVSVILKIGQGYQRIALGGLWFRGLKPEIAKKEIRTVIEPLNILFYLCFHSLLKKNIPPWIKYLELFYIQLSLKISLLFA